MLSIITAVRNELPVNRLFLNSIKKYSKGQYELIVIDNQSTDGSREFFEEAGCRVIRNSGNYSYPYCQNQGLEAARGDRFAFLNNDIIVSPEWDLRLSRCMEQNGLDVCTPATNDCIESKGATKKLLRRWKRIKYPLLLLFGRRKFSLRLMFGLMYGDWERWTRQRFEKFQFQVMEGFSGSSVVWSGKAAKILGKWNPSVQAADFDLHRRTSERFASHGDLKPVHVALGVYVHHFQRLTSKAKNPPFIDLP